MLNAHSSMNKIESVKNINRLTSVDLFSNDGRAILIQRDCYLGKLLWMQK